MNLLFSWFISSIATFKTSSTHHDVLCVNYGPIESKIEDKAGCASGRVFEFSVRSLQDILPTASLSSNYGHFWLHKNKMVMAVMSNSRLQNSSQQRPRLNTWEWVNVRWLKLVGTYMGLLLCWLNCKLCSRNVSWPSVHSKCVCQGYKDTALNTHRDGANVKKQCMCMCLQLLQMQQLFCTGTTSYRINSF